MKKGLLIFLGIFVFIILALAILPFLFKDKIKAKVDAELVKTVNATIVYDADKFSLSIFKNFPNITITMGDLGVIGKQEEFKGDTLFYAHKMNVEADLMSVIKGDKIRVKSIYLLQPKIITITAKNGKSSWDLMIATPEDTTKKGEEELTEFTVALDKWEIEDGFIVYDDRTLPMYAELRHVTHTGKGDLTQEVFDMDTYTKSPDVLVVYDGITYLDKHAMEADMKININYVKSEYKFLENHFKINDFKFGFDGMLAMPTADINMDLTFKAEETDFKNLLSLIPSVFLKDYDKVKTEGKIAFDGRVKGIYNERSMPAFGLNLKINNAMMQYPDLPTAVSNIVADIMIDNKDGIMNNTIIDVKKFHMDMGKNPVDARVLVEGLDPYKIDADVQARINLEDLTKMFPIEGTTLRGLYNLNVKAKGVYSDTLKLMPVVDAKMSLSNGYVKTKDFPEPLENVNFDAVVNSAGALNSSKALINNFTMLLEKEPFNIKAYVENFANPAYDVNIKGIVDLTKLTKIYPLDGMTLSGRVNADIATKGVMSDVEAGRYEKTATSGTLDISNFKYVSKDMPQGISLSKANFTLTPEKMLINNMTGFAGKSDIDVKGYFANYMGYMFGKQDTTIRGTMTLKSNKFDVNEWMTEDQTSSTSSSKPEVFEVPKNIDFALTSSLNTVLYDNMTMTNMAGVVIMKNGIVKMDNLTFNMLGGAFATTGTYNTQDITTPKFDLALKIDNINIRESYNTFATVKAFAPIAKTIDGNFSTTLNFNGILGNDMMPKMNTVSGNGIAKVLSAQVTENKVLAGISNLTKISDINPLSLKDILLKFKISEGKLFVEPFDVNVKGMKMNIGGSNAADGGVDYVVKMDVPAGAVGASVNSALSKLTGKASDNPQNIKLDLKVGGTYDNPSVSLLGSSLKDQAKDAVTNAVKDKVKDELKNNAEVKKASDQIDNLKKENEEKLKTEQDRLKKEAEARLKSQQDSVKKSAENELKNKIKGKLPKF